MFVEIPCHRSFLFQKSVLLGSFNHKLVLFIVDIFLSHNRHQQKTFLTFSFFDLIFRYDSNVVICIVRVRRFELIRFFSWMLDLLAVEIVGFDDGSKEFE